MFTIIGLGLHDEQDITLRGLELAKEADIIFLEAYTSRLYQEDVDKLEKMIGKKIQKADREFLESGRILIHCHKHNVVLLVPGDPMVATTHSDLLLRAREEKIKTKIVHNAGIMNAVLDTGLQFYKFGKTTTITFWEGDYKPTSFYDAISRNKKTGMHTLCLLDIDVLNDRYMVPEEAIRRLLLIQKQRGENIIKDVIVCSRMGTPDEKIIYGNALHLQNMNFGKPLHCLIIPGDMHDMEKDFLKSFKVDEHE